MGGGGGRRPAVTMLAAPSSRATQIPAPSWHTARILHPAAASGADLNVYKSNLIKESIRMGHNELGDFFYSRGDLQARAVLVFCCAVPCCAVWAGSTGMVHFTAALG